MTDLMIGRRGFIRAATLAVAALPVRPAFGHAVSAEGLRIAALLPGDDSALRGVRLGVHEAQHAARLFGTTVTLHEAAPDADVRSLVIQHRVHAVLGGADAGQADALAASADAAGVLFLNVGAAADDMSRRCGALTFHLLPSRAMRADALAAVQDAPAGARAVAWHAALERFGAAQVTDRYHDMFAAAMDERAWARWMAMKVLFDASQRADTTDARELAAFLLSPRASYDGHKGMQLSFRPGTRQLRQPLYVVAGDRVIAEVPNSRELGDRTHAELLDTLGTAEVDPCAR